MIVTSKATEYRIVVPGKAVSFRSPKSENYKKLIAQEARKVLKGPLRTQPFDIYLDYFHVTPRRMDMDNISKCVMDALNGVLYVDDKQVRYQRSVAHDLTVRSRLRGGPADLIKPLRKYDEYLFIRAREIVSDGRNISGNRPTSRSRATR